MKNIKKSPLSLGSLTALTIAMVLVLFSLPGCKKYYDPPFVNEEQQDVTKKRRKVLLVVVDGATGVDVKAIAPPKITAMLTNSKYSWDGLSDIVPTDAGNWKNIMTGVGTSKHQIIDESFDVPPVDDGHEHDGSNTAYPTLIERLQSSGKVRKSVGITSWAALNNKLFIYADEPVQVASDLAAKDTAVVKLKSITDDLVIVNFNDVNKAGLSYGFSADVPEYKAAVLTTDGYIGELLETIKTRKNYASEEWLVVITSSHGGLNKGFTSGSKRERNIFTLYYCAGFKGEEILSLPVTDAITLANKQTVATLPAADASIYNPGKTADFTVQFKVYLKSKPTANGSHSVLFSKINHAYSSCNGWEFMVESPSQKFRVILGDGTLTYFYAPSASQLNIWYTLAFKIFTKDGKRYGQFFVDGAPTAAPTDITGRTFGNATGGLTAGAIASSIGVCSEIVSNVAIYNTALSDAAIADFACQGELTNADPYYNNLIGYWPCSEGSGKFFVNKSPLAVGKDMTITNTTAWSTMGRWSCTPPPANRTSLVVQNTDIAPQIYYWYGVSINDKWGLDGKVFLESFESEFIK
ncbi:LamG-like jellyroll fold domain-containing protein [Pedobacter hiemivivus]|uniref:DUF4983 domain-containing protein n=1 Tax=Pedobacter hiemivivus TaxID=2530454 RepID=A0A4R0MDN3_9SPHI|nr:LamG-like jellyroll fold domain-containing protein [Pedobacter hiemivivus]TCC84500.1 DUF4983 domain-containing protein [Pedobacter hiemivivus]